MIALLVVAGCSGGGGRGGSAKPHEIHRRGDCPPEREDGAYDLDATQARSRRGATDRTFADSRSTQDRPLQLCGVAGTLDYLVRVTCSDGSHPFASRAAAHAARTGSGMTPGLVCQRPVEQYVVPCGDRTYELYFDIYQCGPGEELFRDAGLSSTPAR